MFFHKKIIDEKIFTKNSIFLENCKSSLFFLQNLIKTITENKIKELTLFNHKTRQHAIFRPMCFFIPEQ